jgi:hypothetical protein
MNLKDIAINRLYNQRLVSSGLSAPEEVVAWLGAVQAQEYACKMGPGMRLRIDIHDADIEQAFNSGLILRTHVMRPT